MENLEVCKAPTGTKDILPEEAYLWEAIEKKARETFTTYGYKPIRTPILEHSSLFNRSLGGETEIVKKQMFEIKRQQEDFCLRPEATAAVVRAYLENNLDKTNAFIKLYYTGPMFRAERPQKGRLRQFHHIGVEVLGSSSPYLDSEVIDLADKLLQAFHITGYEIKINSLGCLPDKQKLSQLLRLKLAGKLAHLCADCKDRFQRNVFRILDCKQPGCTQVVTELALSNSEYLCGECTTHFLKVREILDSIKLKYTPALTLVRGLDYYTRTVFEISHSELGAQDALGAGGRYDTLISELGGPKLGAIGFALGVERLLLVSKYTAQKQTLKVFIIALGEEARKEVFLLLSNLRVEGIACDIDYEERSLKAQMRKANDAGARFVALMGDNELTKHVVTLKDMQSGKQEEINLSNFVEELKKR